MEAGSVAAQVVLQDGVVAIGHLDRQARQDCGAVVRLGHCHRQQAVRQTHLAASVSPVDVVTMGGWCKQE